MPQLSYLDLTYTELAALHRDRTVAVSAVSPVEVHGPHLPLGTDLFIAEELRDRVARLIGERRPDWNVLVLPSLAAGSDPIPLPGSVEVAPAALEGVVRGWARALAGQGFRYWVLLDNHGGPHHQLAIETAGRGAARKGLHLIAPFHLEFRRMVALDPELLEVTGLAEGTVGDITDSHAGTNETSLMLAAMADAVRPGYAALGQGRVSPRRGLTRALATMGRLLGRLGASDAATDFRFISNALAWVSDPQMESYQGRPCAADPAAGERMLEYRAAVAIELLEAAISGVPVQTKPLGWSIRRLRKII
ncbi:MAG: creatininase family protein [Actinobacteria bacterium]|nr:creatininase family protein [Actinomycetota bacterium]